MGGVMFKPDFSMRIMSKVRYFGKAFLNQTAQNRESESIRDWGGFIFFILGSISSLISHLKSILVDTFGFFAPLIPYLILIAAYISSIYVIKEVDRVQGKYLHGPVIRNIAKVGFLILPFLIFIFSINLYTELYPLPKTVYGYVYNVNNSLPIVNARIRVMTNDSVDITDGEWQTDSRGFFIVQAKTTIRRDYKLFVLSSDCIKGVYLPFSKIYELKENSSPKPLFKYTINVCDKEK